MRVVTRPADKPDIDERAGPVGSSSFNFLPQMGRPGLITKDTPLHFGALDSLEDLVDRVDGPLGSSVAGRHREEPIEEGVLRVPGLEAHGVVRK